MAIRLDTIAALDRLTDGRTDGCSTCIAFICWRAIKLRHKNRTEVTEGL